MDGYLYEQYCKAACDGVVRDAMGSWITGFGRKLEVCFSLQAELLAILTTLEIAWVIGF